MGMAQVATFDWTPEATALALKLWGDGVSASAIARELGQGLTRNGVLGKLHRLKAAKGIRVKPVTVKSRERRSDDDRAADRGVLSAVRARPAAKPKKGQVQGAGGGSLPRAGGLIAMKFGDGFTSEPKPPQVELVVGPAFAPLPGFEPVRLADHQNHQCRWPIDVEGEFAARCCGAPRDGEHVYCASHRARGVAAVTPPRPGQLGLTELQTRKRTA